MSKKFPLNPKHPERICWGCDRYCPVTSLDCGNGSERTMHPVETFGEDWHLSGDWGLALETEAEAEAEAETETETETEAEPGKAADKSD